MSKDENRPLWDIMVVIILAAALPWWAFVFKTAWAWFVVPLGVPAIGMAHAFGMSLIMKAIVPHQAKNKKRRLDRN